MKRNDIDDLTPYQKRKKNSTLKNTNKRAPKANEEDANLAVEEIGEEVTGVEPKSETKVNTTGHEPKKKTSSTKKTSKPKKKEEPVVTNNKDKAGHESGHEA